MSWENTLKGYGKGSRRTFDTFKKAKSVAFSWSFRVPHVIREKDGKFTVMMKDDGWGLPEADFGPVVWEQKGRRL